MQKTHILLLINFLIFFQNKVYAEWFHGDDIDYWQENKKVIPKNHNSESAKNAFQANSIIRAKDNEQFDWNNYNDPSRVEFFDDGGDFVPNRPWREVMAHPTQENIQKYMAWQAKKIKLSNDVGKMMADSSGMPLPLSDQPKLNLAMDTHQSVQFEKSKILWNRIQVTYFYRSSCHFCQKSMPVVAALKEHGVLFIPVQLDWAKEQPLYPESAHYDDKLKQAYPIKGTPTWLIKRADKPQQEPLEIDGYVSEEQLEKAISAYL